MKKQTLLLAMIVFVVLIASSFATALGTITVDEVELEINGQNVRSESENIKLNVMRDETIDLDVEFVAYDDMSDVKVEAFIVGYEHDHRETMRDSTRYFDIKKDSEYRKGLSLHLPELMEPGMYTLRVQFQQKNADTLEFRYNLDIDTPDDSLSIRDVMFTPGNTIKAGTSFIANVRLKNTGNELQDNVKVTVAIPELGRVDTVYVDEVEAEEYVSSEPLVLNVPLCAEEKEYQVNVLVEYNDYEEVQAMKPIRVTKNDACSADSTVLGSGFEAQSVISSASATAGQKVNYPVILTNNGDKEKIVYLSANGNEELGNIRVAPNWVVSIAPLSSMTAYVEVTPSADAAEGDHAFTIKATDGLMSKELAFNTKVNGASEAGSNNWLLISVVIVAVLLILIIIIVLFNKMNSDDDDDEDYY